MWIRSQDKRTLVNANRLWIAGAGIIYNLPPTSIEGDSDLLGKYKNLERAMEVLDDIQKHLENSTEIIKDVSNSHCIHHIVYQMPEE